MRVIKKPSAIVTSTAATGQIYIDIIRCKDMDEQQKAPTN